MNWIGGLLLGTVLSTSLEKEEAFSTIKNMPTSATPCAIELVANTPSLRGEQLGPMLIGPMLINATEFRIGASDLDPDGEAQPTVDGELPGSQSQSGQSRSESAEKGVREKRQVLVFKAVWCGACQGLNYEWPRLKQVRWRVGSEETAHFRLVDADERPDLITRYGVTQLPTVLLLVDGKVQSRHGALSARDLAELYYGRLR